MRITSIIFITVFVVNKSVVGLSIYITVCKLNFMPLLEFSLMLTRDGDSVYVTSQTHHIM